MIQFVGCIGNTWQRKKHAQAQAHTAMTRDNPLKRRVISILFINIKCRPWSGWFHTKRSTSAFMLEMFRMYETEFEVDFIILVKKRSEKPSNFFLIDT